MVSYMSGIFDTAQKTSDKIDLLFQMKAKMVRRLLESDLKQETP